MNRRQHYTLSSSHAWNRGTRMHLAADADLEIRRKEVFRAVRRDEADHPRLVRPVIDAAVGPDGRWLLLDHTVAVWKADMATGHMETVLNPGHGWFGGDASIAVAGETWAVADPNSVPTLIVFSLDNAQVLWSKTEWRGEPYRALAVAADGDRRITVLAAFGQEGEASVYRVLRYAPSGEETDAIDAALPPAAEEAQGTEEAPNRDRRFELTMDDSGNGWLLDREADQPIRIDYAAGELAFAVLSDAIRPIQSIQAAPGGMYWALRRDSERQGRMVQLLDPDGKPSASGDAGPGNADRLYGGSDGRLFVWDRVEAVVTTLRAKPEIAVWEQLQRRMGVWIGTSLDSFSIETQWHKIVMEREGEPDTQVRVRYYASDHPEAVVGGQLVHLDSYIANGLIPPEEKFAALRGLWSEPIVDPQDALLFGAQGRYLWLCIELLGSESNTPRVSGLQVHFPRESYLQDLPALYQQDRRSADFLDRFLSMFQTMLEETDERISEVPRAFDPEAASGRTLRWLLGWLGLRQDDHWTDEQLRELLKAAPTIYKLRGTRYAVETLVRIYTGENPIVMEYDQVKPLKEHPQLGGVADRLYSPDPNGFNVLVKLEHADTEQKRAMLQHLIDSCKPAFATAKLIVLQPWVYMDLHSYLGLNTVLSEPTLLTLDGMSSMPHHTITIDVGQHNRVDQHTRLGLDSRLE